MKNLTRAPGDDFAPGKSGLELLVVDDDPLTRMYCRSVLGQAGHDCITATNGADALRLFQEYQPAAILSDLHLPDMTGPELICLMFRSQRPEASFNRWIALTGSSDRRLHESCWAAGAAAILQKPFERRQLLGAVNELWSSRAVHRQPASNTHSETWIRERTAHGISEPLPGGFLTADLGQRLVQLVAQEIEQVDLYLATTEWSRLTSILHRLAGAAAMGNQPRLAELCKDLQKQVIDQTDGVRLASTYVAFRQEAASLLQQGTTPH